MRKIKLISGIAFAIIIAFFSLIISGDHPLNYEDYNAMMVLVQKENLDLKNLGYSKYSIKKIRQFNHNYQNHLKLLDMIENGELKHKGYNNRLKRDENNELPYTVNRHDIRDDDLMHNTTIMDFLYDKKIQRDVARIGISFEWKVEPYNQKQLISLEFHNYASTEIYTLLKYVNVNDNKDIEYRMCELDDTIFVQEFSTEFNSKINVDNKRYVLESGIVVLDVRSFYGESIAPIMLTSQYISKPILWRDKILSKQIIGL